MSADSHLSPLRFASYGRTVKKSKKQPQSTGIHLNSQIEDLNIRESASGIARITPRCIKSVIAFKSDGPIHFPQSVAG